MASVELSLLKSLYCFKLYIAYNKYLNIIYNKVNNKSLYKLYTAISHFHEKYPDRDIKDTSELELFFYTLYPASNQRDRDEFTTLFRRINEQEVDPALSEGYLNACRERLNGHRIALLGLEVAEGRKPWDDAQIEFKAILEGFEDSNPKENPFVSSSLKDLYERQTKEVGIRWPLHCLNHTIGSLRRGDYGIIFARPETGKTTFISHCCAYAASLENSRGHTTDSNPILWFNNEQAGETVQSYAYRSVLGLTDQQLYATIEENEKRYKELTNDKIRIYDAASIHRKDVESILREYGASLVVFDQIPKLKGFEDDRDDLKLGAIHQWARELAKQYAPVIGVCQAGESGANKRWLTMEDIVNVKTAAQAEADFIIGIGKIELEGYENVRFLNICKNKLVGDSDTDPKRRHDKLEVLINAPIARYEDVR